ncbi:MAG: hypothetical protein FWB80_06550 [Defluviitaleaceae bacterium]|nr:hypothetical protein [Defluviitaleaceae bacterium]
MAQTTERVILIKGDGTKWYNQAIFIVNKDTPAIHMPVDFVAEAEKIICNHMATGKKAAAPAVYTSHMPKSYTQPTYNAPATHTGTKKTTKPASKFDFVLNMVMVLACVAIVAVFAYGMMS